MATLKKIDQIQLANWIGRECHFDLLYAVSRDGCTGAKFHELCDNKGPTVTVFFNADDNVYGGYASKSWTSNSEWVNDNVAFLFKLYTKNMWKPQQFTNKCKDQTFACENKWGPWFRELHSFKSPIEKKTNVYNLDKESLFNGEFFNIEKENAGSIASGHNNVKDLVVYAVLDGPGSLTPWRIPPLWTLQACQDLKDFISTYQPPKDLDVPDVNILLVGAVGAGKSSFLNTVNSIFHGDITSRACTGSSDHSLTTKLQQLRVRDPSSGSYMHVRLFDTPGIEEDLSIKQEDIGFILDGHLPNQYKFNPFSQASPDVPDFKQETSIKDKIHVVTYVIDASTIGEIKPGVVHTLSVIKRLIVDRGVPLVVLLTKLDKVCQLVENDITNIFKIEMVEGKVNEVAQMIAIPRSHVLPVKNYEKETELQTEISILALHVRAMKQILTFANDYFENYLDMAVIPNKTFAQFKSND
ncbi:interferon-induced protein 44-like [Saccostrea cucullata]|uniref:interferon-induced protein 44-like n=1 Tax=Saccostrea cuccullata TaxID=36930 RepID=UPI002ED62B67